MTDTPNSGAVSVSREWLSDLQTFLEEAYDGGIEGLIQEECGNQLVELRAILAQPAEQQDELVGEIVAFGHTLHEVSWRKGRMPDLGTKLYRRPAAQAVKLPERLPGDDGVCTESHHAAGWNECRAETAKLNGIDP